MHRWNFNYTYNLRATIAPTNSTDILKGVALVDEESGADAATGGYGAWDSLPWCAAVAALLSTKEITFANVGDVVNGNSWPALTSNSRTGWVNFAACASVMALIMMVSWPPIHTNDAMLSKGLAALTRPRRPWWVVVK